MLTEYYFNRIGDHVREMAEETAQKHQDIYTGVQTQLETLRKMMEGIRVTTPQQNGSTTQRREYRSLISPQLVERRIQKIEAGAIGLPSAELQEQVKRLSHVDLLLS